MTTDYVHAFCGYYHVYNNISAPRRVEQERVLREFEASLAGDLDDIDAGALRSYLTGLVHQGLAPTTIRKRLNMIRPLLHWLWEQKVIDAARLMELRDVKPPRGGNGNGQPNPYTQKEIQRFWRELAVTYPWAKAPLGKQMDRAQMFMRRWLAGTPTRWASVQPYFMRRQVEAVIALALYAGLRRDEIYNLDLEAMHPDNEYIVVRGARKNLDAEERERAVPWMGDVARKMVGDWLDLREELNPTHDFPWLSVSYFERTRFEPMTHDRFGGLLAKIGSGYEYRRMRHTFGTEALRAGLPLEQLSKVMGHSRIQQTLAYAKIVEADVVKGVARVERDFNRRVGRDS